MNIGRFWRRRERDRELQEEMAAHIAHEVDENVARGLTPEEARRRALVKFGSREGVREDVWKWNSMAVLESVLRDLRHVLRALRRAPGFALAVMLVMALGIGAVTAMFTIVRSVLLKPLPYGDADRLVMLYEWNRTGRFFKNPVAGGMVAAWRKEAKSYERIALLENDEYALAGNGQLPERMIMTMVSWEFFPTLSAQPAIGRVFDESDDRRSADGVIVLSWGLWKRRYGGDAGVLGQRVQLEGKPYTVIGVMPAWFSYPATRTQAWIPAYHELEPEVMESRQNHQFEVIAKLKPGAAPEAGAREVDTIEKRLHAEYRDEVIGAGATSESLMESIVGDYKTPLYALLAATVLVLVIGCLNVANLFVARAAARRKELAVRSALGGSRWRLLWEQVLESLMLSAIGGAAGLALAFLAVRWVVQTRHEMARANSIGMDGTIIVFALGLICVSGLFAGLIAAMSATGNAIETLRESSRTHTGGPAKARLRKGLLCVEMALTVVLLIGAGLLIKSYNELRNTDLGSAVDGELTMHFALPDSQYRSDAQKAAFYERLIREVRRLPGVEKAGLVTRPPGTGYGGDNNFTIVGHPPLPQGEFTEALRRFAEPGYFEAMGVPLLRGRTFRDGERLEKANVVLISDQLAREYFRDEEPIGQHIRTNPTGEMKEYEVIGVVGDTRFTIGHKVEPTAYYPLYSGWPSLVFLVAKAKGDPLGIALPIQKTLAEMDPDLAVSDVLTMEQVIGGSTTSASFNAELTLGFAVLSLLLASVGLYGVLAYLVAQRTTEIGVRIALGSERGQIVSLMVADGMRPVLAGLVLGLGGGVAAARMIRELLYGVKPMDGSVFATVAVVLLIVAGAACVVPAWRASRLDPVKALRIE